ncbi:PREDICTED: uncharacterized protein LOC108578206 [Habropoda laboriosa]|uniref:uncharacterized protein LOC108578206 n=1 Tax=Habropoda laboriosa TaxID=597456 RepID=UPI00083CC204|nr:PREDICTED: uncharacterized protein LOC108578206 [Habropoda laboriosa]
MTEEQLSRLLSVLETRRTPSPTMTQGSFARCTARFDGSRERSKVEDFISTVSIYKDIEGISDENAIRGLPLLLDDEAAICLQNAYAPKRQPYTVYAEIFATKQDNRIPTDVFLAKKRALLAELPQSHTEEVQLDILCGLLKLSTRERIPRDSI